MTQKDLKLVLTEANNEDFDYPIGSTACEGIAYWAEKKMVTLSGAVSFLRWQAKQLNDEWDSEMLRESLVYLQKKAILI